MAIMKRGIHRPRLMKTLGFKNNKIPKDYQGMCWENAYDVYGTLLGCFFFTIRKQEGKCKHRIYVQCSNCRMVVPFGRFHQHFLTQRCRNERAKMVKGKVRSC